MLEEEPFGVLCKLPNLKSIRMDGTYYVGNELVARTEHNFPALVDLSSTLNACGDPTPRVLQFEAKSMPKLETLKLEFNHHYKSIEGIEHLTSLREVEIIGDKTNLAINDFLEQLQAERGRRPEPNQFQIAAKI